MSEKEEEDEERKKQRVEKNEFDRFILRCFDAFVVVFRPGGGSFAGPAQGLWPGSAMVPILFVLWLARCPQPLLLSAGR